MKRKRTKRVNVNAKTGEKINIIDGKGGVIASFDMPKGGITFHLEPDNLFHTPAQKLQRDVYAYYNAMLVAIEDLSTVDFDAAEETAAALGVLDLFKEDEE